VAQVGRPNEQYIRLRQGLLPMATAGQVRLRQGLLPMATAGQVRLRHEASGGNFGGQAPLLNPF
jgi:hypothetical protein